MIHEYLHIISDPAHILAEVSVEFFTGIIVYPFARWAWKRAIRKHDREVHYHEKQR